MSLVGKKKRTLAQNKLIQRLLPINFNLHQEQRKIKSKNFITESDLRSEKSKRPPKKTFEG